MCDLSLVESCETAYGLFLDIDGPLEESIRKALMAPANKTVEVAVRFRGVTKEYTIRDFLEALGFDGEDDFAPHPGAQISGATADGQELPSCLSGT